MIRVVTGFIYVVVPGSLILWALELPIPRWVFAGLACLIVVTASGEFLIETKRRNRDDRNRPE